MSLNHHTPPPAPGPLCVIYKPQLALLVLGKLDEDQEAEVRAHVAGCEYCQVQLREYAIVREAVARHFGGAATEPRASTGSAMRSRSAAAAKAPLTLEDIMQAANKPSTPVQTGERPTQPRDLSPRRRALTALGAIAAVLVLAVLAASLFSYLGSRGNAPAVKPTPTRGLDAQSQAYANVLETYYQPVGQTYDQEESCLEGEGLTSSASTKLSDMQACQALESAVIDKVHTFDSHLTLPPPTRWQTADTQFKQANQALVTSFTASVQATTVTEWEGLHGAEQIAKQSYCTPVNQINRDLLSAGLPLSSQLPLPIHAAACPSS